MRIPTIMMLLISAALLSTVECGSPPYPRDDCPDFCPLEMAKVCGSDGVTYNTACDLARARCHNGANKQLHVVTVGRCGMDCSGVCPTTSSPVCGSDYKTYINECELQRAQCRSGDVENPGLVSYHACIGGPIAPGGGEIDEEPIGNPTDIVDDWPTSIDDDTPTTTASPSVSTMAPVCPTIQFPVCGSNAKTYDNLCWLAVAHHKDANIHPVSRGHCASLPQVPFADEECAFLCPLIYDPVCVSNGATFENKCTHARAFCQDQSLPAARAAYCDPLLLATANQLTRKPTNN